MARTATESRSLASGPTIESTRDYWVLHLRARVAGRTISTYLNALRRLDDFLAPRGMPNQPDAVSRSFRRRRHGPMRLVEPRHAEPLRGERRE